MRLFSLISSRSTSFPSLGGESSSSPVGNLYLTRGTSLALSIFWGQALCPQPAHRLLLHKPRCQHHHFLLPFGFLAQHEDAVPKTAPPLSACACVPHPVRANAPLSHQLFPVHYLLGVSVYSLSLEAPAGISGASAVPPSAFDAPSSAVALLFSFPFSFFFLSSFAHFSPLSASSDFPSSQ